MPRFLLNGAAILVLIGPLAIALASLSAHGHRWPDILAQFTAPALAGTVVLVVLLALFRLWPAAWTGVAVCALLLLAVQPQWFPPRAVAAEGPALTLYSANLWARNADVAAIRRSIEAADADVLVLIEFGDAPAAQVDAVLAGYPHRVMTRRAGRASGPVRSVIASRLPLERLDNGTGAPETAIARIDAPFGPVNVMAMHLTRPWPYQFQWGQIIQTGKIVERRRSLAGPVIVAGDFNATAAGRIGRMLRVEAGLQPAPGFPGTWPAALPGALRVTIDQVYHSPELVVLDRRLGLPTGSDHRPVVVRFGRSLSFTSRSDGEVARREAP